MPTYSNKEYVGADFVQMKVSDALVKLTEGVDYKLIFDDPSEIALDEVKDAGPYTLRVALLETAGITAA